MLHVLHRTLYCFHVVYVHVHIWLFLFFFFFRGRAGCSICIKGTKVLYCTDKSQRMYRENAVSINTPWGHNRSTHGHTDLGCYTELREKFKRSYKLILYRIFFFFPHLGLNKCHISTIDTISSLTTTQTQLLRQSELGHFALKLNYYACLCRFSELHTLVNIP